VKIFPNSIDKTASSTENSTKKVKFVDEVDKIKEVMKTEGSKNAKKELEYNEAFFVKLLVIQAVS